MVRGREFFRKSRLVAGFKTRRVTTTARVGRGRTRSESLPDDRQEGKGSKKTERQTPGEKKKKEECQTHRKQVHGGGRSESNSFRGDGGVLRSKNLVRFRAVEKIRGEK